MRLLLTILICSFYAKASFGWARTEFIYPTIGLGYSYGFRTHPHLIDFRFSFENGSFCGGGRSTNSTVAKLLTPLELNLQYDLNHKTQANLLLSKKIRSINIKRLSLLTILKLGFGSSLDSPSERIESDWQFVSNISVSLNLNRLPPRKIKPIIFYQPVYTLGNGNWEHQVGLNLIYSFNRM